MKSISINSRVENGKVKSNITLLKNAFSQFEGKEIEITIKRKTKKRSLPQNAFYWGVTIPFFRDLIYNAWGELLSTDDIHTLLKSKCNYEEKVNEETGEIVTLPRSTTDLTTSGWMDFEARMDTFALNFFNTTLPKPNEQMSINY